MNGVDSSERKTGTPTIVAWVVVIVLSMVFLPNIYNQYNLAATGHAYAELIGAGVSDSAAVARAKEAGSKSGTLMVLGQHLPFTLLLLIAIGLISKTTSADFKSKLKVSFFIVVLVGSVFLAIGSSYWGNAPEFSEAIGPAIGIYAMASAILWTIIGIGVAIRGKPQALGDM